jgi:NADH-quinone oxidoreductase subunit N
VAFTGQTFLALLPELIALGFAMLVLLIGVFFEKSVGLVAALAALGALAVFGSAAGLLAAGFSGEFFGGGYVVDSFALYFKLVSRAARSSRSSPRRGGRGARGTRPSTSP